jgi:hypothetical protein
MEASQMSVELVPDITNVVYIDEYPELAKRVWLRRLNAQRQLGKSAVGTELQQEWAKVVVFERPDPDGAA